MIIWYIQSKLKVFLHILKYCFHTNKQENYFHSLVQEEIQWTVKQSEH